MLIALYAHEAAHVLRLVASAPAHVQFLRTSNWKQFGCLALEAEVAIACFPILSERLIGLIRHFSRGRTSPRVVIACDDLRTDGDDTDGLGVDAIVPLSDEARSLWSAVQHVNSRLRRRQIARQIDAASHVPEPLRSALGACCDSAAPVPSVVALATQRGCARSTLEYQWSILAGGVCPGIRLKDFIDWIIFLRALSIKGSDTAWRQVADATGVHEQRLQRISRRFTRLPLRTREDLDRVAETRFRETLLDRILYRAPLDQGWPG